MEVVPRRKNIFAGAKISFVRVVCVSRPPSHDMFASFAQQISEKRGLAKQERRRDAVALERERVVLAAYARAGVSPRAAG